MSSTKKFGLNNLTLQGRTAQNALRSMRSFYQGDSATAAIQTQQQQPQQMNRAAGSRNGVSWVKGALSDSNDRVGSVGRLSKLLGVKRTLVNQVQGMTQTMQNRFKSPPSTCKYNIYGKTKLFSSMSSMHDWSSSNSGHIFNPATQNRCLSSISQPAISLNSMGQQRYTQFGDMQDVRNGELAKDISRSIQSELMEVDSTTKKLISCARTKLPQSVEEHQQQQLQQQQLQMQPHHQPIRYDPLEGWKHPRPVKIVEAVTNLDSLKKQFKPMRRKLGNARYHSDARETFEQQLSKANAKSSHFKAKLNELYNSSTKLHSKKHRSDLREPRLPSMATRTAAPAASAEENFEPVGVDGRHTLMPSARNTKKPTEHEEASVAPVQASGRMDDQHDQSKMGNNLMSATQRVIHKQFDGYSLGSYLGGARKVMSTNNVESATSVASEANKSSKPATPKTRFSLMHSLGKQKKPKSIPRADVDAKMAQSKDDHPELRRQKTHFMQRHSTSSGSSKKAAAKKLEEAIGSKYRKPSWKNASQYRQYGQQDEEGQTSESYKILQAAEMRESKRAESTASDSPANDVLMPTQYTKESAAQRLGFFVKRSSALEKRFYPQQFVVRQ